MKKTEKIVVAKATHLGLGAGWWVLIFAVIVILIALFR